MAVGAFGIGTGEFVIMGLLPNVADNLHVSIPAGGHLISAYALGVVVGAPTLIAASTRMARKPLLIALMVAFTIGNVLSALAPGYGWLLAARFVTGLPHGAYFGVASVVAGGLVEPARRTRAMSTMFAGLTISNIIGVPLSTMLGQHVGWRPVFMLVSVIGVLAVLAVWIVVPSQHLSAAPLNLRSELRALGRRQVVLACATATIGGAALFSTYTYITPMVTHITGYAQSSVTPLLVLFGIGMTIGNLVGARLVDRALMPSLYTFLALDAVIAALFVLTLHNKVATAITMVVFAASTFAVVPALQTRIIDGAGDAPNIASGANQAAFNVANALGAWLGGLVIAAGYGYAAPNLVASGLAVLGLIIAIISGRDKRVVGGPGALIVADPGVAPARTPATGRSAAFEVPVG
jgi:DHA1 family inner membrane transport protein